MVDLSRGTTTEVELFFRAAGFALVCAVTSGAATPAVLMNRRADVEESACECAKSDARTTAVRKRSRDSEFTADILGG